MNAQPIPDPVPPPLILELARLEAIVQELRRRISLMDPGGLTTSNDWPKW